jgi:hypothetical protein
MNEQTPPLPNQEANPTPYKGVGGWLLFFCIVLTIIGPLVGIFNLASGFATCYPLLERFPALILLLLVDTILSLALIAFGIVTGIMLWRVLPNARKIAKIYLWSSLGYAVIATILPFVVGLPQETYKAMLPEVIGTLFKGMIFFGIWFSYLCTSKRVKATYES